MEGLRDLTFLLHIVQRYSSKYGLHLQIKPVEKRRRKKEEEREEEEREEEEEEEEKERVEEEKGKVHVHVYNTTILSLLPQF